jgi:hypothetical protein
MVENRPRPQVAFIAASLALLVLALLVMVGLSMLGIAVGMFSRADRMMNGEAAWVFLAFFIAWVVLVVGGVLLPISRLIRRTTHA